MEDASPDRATMLPSASFETSVPLLERLIARAMKAAITEEPPDPAAFLARHFAPEAHARLAVLEAEVEALRSQLAAATGELEHTRLGLGPTESSATTRPIAASATGALPPPPNTTATLSHTIAAWRASDSAKAYKAAATATTGVELHTRFAAAAGTFTYTYGDVSQFFAGLEGLVGLPVADFLLGMSLEHASDEPFSAWNSDVKRVTTPRAEYTYVVERPAGDVSVPDRTADATGARCGWRLRDFAAQEPVRKAALLRAEVVGVRLYTGPMYVHYNGVLRRRARGAYVTTLHAINSAILKLSKQTRACTVYRGVSGGVLPDAFWEENEHGVRGGVELGFMSTTTEKHVALGYMAQRGSAARMLFQVRMGMIDRGADVAALSQFPGENEILFAPLTGLEVVSPPCDVDGVLVVELRLSCNLHDLTIEEVAGKMRASHLALLDGMARSLEYAGTPEPALAPLRRVRDAAVGRGAEFFNVPALFLHATGEALEANKHAIEALADEGLAWGDGAGGEEVAERLRAAAEYCAREEAHATAAALLVRAVAAAGGAPAEHAAAVEAECKDFQFAPTTAQRRALEAASLLLVDGMGRRPPWPLTLVELARAGGKQGVAQFLAMRHRQPSSVVQRSLFDEDSSTKTRRPRYGRAAHCCTRRRQAMSRRSTLCWPAATRPTATRPMA